MKKVFSFIILTQFSVNYGFEASVFTVTKHAVSFVRNLDTAEVKSKKVGSRLHKVLGFVSGSLATDIFTQFMTIAVYHAAGSNRANAPDLLRYARISYPVPFWALPSLVLPTSSSSLTSSSLSLYLLSLLCSPVSCLFFLVACFLISEDLLFSYFITFDHSSSLAAVIPWFVNFFLIPCL